MTILVNPQHVNTQKNEKEAVSEQFATIDNASTTTQSQTRKVINQVEEKPINSQTQPGSTQAIDQ